MSLVFLRRLTLLLRKPLRVYILGVPVYDREYTTPPCTQLTKKMDIK
jgi:hypothetical protein